MTAPSALAERSSETMNAIIRATSGVFDRMVDCEITRTSLELFSGVWPANALKAVCRLTGEIRGTVALVLDTETVSTVVRCLVDEEVDGTCALSRSTVGELCNVITGSARMLLSVHRIEMTLPLIYSDEVPETSFPRGVPIMCARFDSQVGPFMLVFAVVL